MGQLSTQRQFHERLVSAVNQPFAPAHGERLDVADCSRSPNVAQFRRLVQWSSPLPSPTSKIVTAGMNRLCGDFGNRIAPLGFTKSGSKVWSRQNGPTIESIQLQRKGSSYGAPLNASVHVRVVLGTKNVGDNSSGAGRVVYSDASRKTDGRAYHHKFNAETWSTYERCLDELSQYVAEVAESWFREKHK
ncbi:MAG: hypothetical protein WAU68_11715 [Vitreimonas sp.]